MKDLTERKLVYLDDAIDAIEKVARLFPYRIPGNRDTYDQYNEAWNDAVGRAEIEIEALPSAQPQSTMGQANEAAQSTNDCISRQAAIDAEDSK